MSKENRSRQQMVLNIQGSHFRNEVKDHRPYMVVTAVPVISKVLNHNFLPAEEIAKSVRKWNGVPLTFDHPWESARTPSVEQIGTYYSANYDQDGLRLTGEMWFDLEVLDKLDNGARLLSRIQTGQMVEVSTGYYAYLNFVSGVYNGEEYDAIQHDIEPDHIAVLLDDLGACSVEDGCGLNRNKNDKEQDVMENFLKFMKEKFGLKLKVDNSDGVSSDCGCPNAEDGVLSEPQDTQDEQNDSPVGNDAPNGDEPGEITDEGQTQEPEDITEFMGALIEALTPKIAELVNASIEAREAQVSNAKAKEYAEMFDMTVEQWNALTPKAQSALTGNIDFTGLNGQAPVMNTGNEGYAPRRGILKED